MFSKEYLEKNEKIINALCVSYRNAIKGNEAQALDESLDFDELLKLADKHAVVFSVYDAVKKSNCPKEILKKWSDRSGLALSKEILFDNELSKIEKKFSENHIRYVPLKGIIIKNLYPKKGMRQFCDFDILVENEKIDNAKAIMMSMGYSVSRVNVSEKNVHEDVSVVECFKAPVFNIELHKKLFWGNKEGYFFDVWDRIIFEPENYKGRMRDEDVYLYHVAHIYSHLNHRSGIGIRYLADHYILREKLFKKTDFDGKYTDEVLKSVELFDFERNLNSITYGFFDSDSLDFSDIYDFLSNGVHGTLQNKVKLGVDDNGKFVYTVKRIFPPLSEMKVSYKSLRKKPFLLPFCWIHRGISVIFNKKRRTLAKKEISAVGKVNTKQKK